MNGLSRRRFLESFALAGGGAVLANARPNALLAGKTGGQNAGSKMRFGLVTYMWAAQWDLPTLLRSCQHAGALGVELRTTHRHGVEPHLGPRERTTVRHRFADSPVTLVGLGSDERFDSPDPAVLSKAIAAAKSFVVLSHDVGGTGVKVKPNDFRPGVPRERTIEQIGTSLNTLGEFAQGYGQQIRLEVHGSCSRLPDIKAIMDVASHRSVAVCWNSNAADLDGKGLEYNFNLVKDRLGATCHVRPLDSKAYPYPQLLQLLVQTDYDGWLMLEDGRVPKDPVAELTRQRKLFARLVAEAL